MANELVINVTLGETRLARLENGVVSELYIERTKDQGVVGNIYKGKVVRVLPGMQAAFVEIGLDRTAFLHAADAVEGGHLDFDVEEEESSKVTRRHRQKIEDLLKEGSEVVVQVEKEPIGTKGARLTSHVSLPGRYLVYMPTVDHVGMSRRIENDKERKRLRQIVEKHRPRGSGFIIRTASDSIPQADIEADMHYLIKTWEEVEPKSRQAKAPALLHAELDVVLRVVRDLFTPDIDRLIIDSETEGKRVKEFVGAFLPELASRVEIYKEETPIFDSFGIEVEITRALGQKVWLKSGGYIIIEQTEALTAIDVNTGRFVGRRNLDETILKTNLEAVKEIVYQLRLRSIGGLIILDFIDMVRRGDQAKVYNALKEALKSDRARTTITKISDLGLVEMTRKRTREDLRRQLTDPCIYCEGKGYLKSLTTIAYEVFRELQRAAAHNKGKQLLVYANAHVANLLYDEERSTLEALEKQLGKRISVKVMDDYHLEQFEVTES